METQLIKREMKIIGLVGSETHEGAFYHVKYDGDDWTCSCPDNVHRANECKHIVTAKMEWGGR